MPQSANHLAGRNIMEHDLGAWPFRVGEQRAVRGERERANSVLDIDLPGLLASAQVPEEDALLEADGAGGQGFIGGNGDDLQRGALTADAGAADPGDFLGGGDVVEGTAP